MIIAMGVARVIRGVRCYVRTQYTNTKEELFPLIKFRLYFSVENRIAFRSSNKISKKEPNDTDNYVVVFSDALREPMKTDKFAPTFHT